MLPWLLLQLTNRALAILGAGDRCDTFSVGPDPGLIVVGDSSFSVAADQETFTLAADAIPFLILGDSLLSVAADQETFTIALDTASFLVPGCGV